MSTARVYDILLIADSRLTDEEVAQLSGRLQESLVGLGGEVKTSENWGKRRLAFEIKKNPEGIYAVIKVTCQSAVVSELDRQLNLNESVLRTKITRPDAK